MSRNFGTILISQNQNHIETQTRRPPARSNDKNKRTTKTTSAETSQKRFTKLNIIIINAFQEQNQRRNQGIQSQPKKKTKGSKRRSRKEGTKKGIRQNCLST